MGRRGGDAEGDGRKGEERKGGRKGKEWEWEGRTPQVSKQIDATDGHRCIVFIKSASVRCTGDVMFF